MSTIVIGALTDGLAVLALAFGLPRRACPRCATRLPRVRKPDSLRDLLLGGWRCPTCQAHVSSRGKLIA